MRDTDKHALEASLIGLKLIKDSDKKNYKTYKFDKCGHIQDIQPTHVRRNSFTCQECKLIQLNKEADEYGLLTN